MTTREERMSMSMKRAGAHSCLWKSLGGKISVVTRLPKRPKRVIVK